MFRILADFGDGYTQVGRDVDFTLALHHGDNLGMMFSQGVRPQTVRVRVENEERGVFVVQHYYNGFVKVLRLEGEANA